MTSPSSPAGARQRLSRPWRWGLALAAGSVLAMSAGAVSGSWRFALVVASSLLATCSTLPYIREIIRGTTKPRLVTWGTWSLLTAMAGVASASVGDYPSAVFSFIGTVATAVVVAVGLRFGDWKSVV